MTFTAEQIAGILDGTIVGNPAAEVFKLSKIHLIYKSYKN
jgi:UDP-3-O-[3-hydroxymyristoyl] glucosamine N-acyltransferase